MGLWEHTIWWHVYPLGAVGAPIRGADPSGPEQHRLLRLLPWLDYVVDLGCNGLLLAPVFASSSHGYDTVDHFRLDPRLGTEEDLDLLVGEARRRGVHVILDGVFNHVGVEHPWVAASLAAGSGPVRLHRDDGQLTPVPWEGARDLALLDHGHPEVEQLVADAMRHWLARGIAGWRLDVAYAVPAEFWRRVIAEVRVDFPEAVFLGEVIHGDYAEIAAAAQLDSVTQYELWKALWSSIQDRNLWELAWALKRHDGFTRPMLPNTFVGNHDVTRIASQLGDVGAALAAVVLMTMPGVPSIYYGDEQGFRGVKGSGERADDALRPALPSGPADLAPHGWWLCRLHQDVIGWRRRHAWIAQASVHVVGQDLTWMEYELCQGEQSLVVRVDLQPVPQVRVRGRDGESFSWVSPRALEVTVAAC